MPKQFWVNLPVKDITRAGEFYEKIGFTVKVQNKQEVQVIIGDQTIMLYEETTFKTFARHEIVDAKQATEVLFSIGAESREEVDDIAEKAVQAGGLLFSKPTEEQGWLYGCGFTDLDGHRWNMLYMDRSKMGKI